MNGFAFLGCRLSLGLRLALLTCNFTLKYFKKIRHFAQLTLPIKTSVRIPQNDISRHVNEIVETIPDSKFDEFRHHRGATSYHPKMMLKIILYAYTQSVFSGRRIEKLLHDSIRMMWLAQDQTPSYKTINRFRVNPNTDALIESLFIQFAYFSWISCISF